MKCTIPEISWHNRDPVLSLDIQPSKGNEALYRLATGGTDSHVLIWQLSVQKGGAALLECAADLTRHTKPVNCVRFSPSGDLLASGDDEACVILWKMKTSSDPAEFPTGEEETFKEQWISVRVLRGHLQDVYDLSWSADSKNLITGSVDNTAILWDIPSGKNLGILAEHKGFVQGVAWDPCSQYVATISSDRVCRVYNSTTRKVVSKIYKGHLPGRPQEPESKPAHYFHDDTLKSFFRRLTFTPDGELLIVPSGLVEEPDKKPTHSTIVFQRNSFQKPVVYFPTLSQYSVAVRCCPVFFSLRQMDSPPLFQLPYRVVIAVATQSNVILYDTQHAAPFAFITNIHYTRLTDLSWSSDGRILVVSSTDGYCSVITFAENELGTVYTGENKQQDNKTPTGGNKPNVTAGKDQPKSPKQKTEDEFRLSENANMPFDESIIKDSSDVALKEINNSKSSAKQENVASNSDNLKSIGNSSGIKETPMEIDDFSLVYEGTVPEPVLEPKMPIRTEVKTYQNKSSEETHEGPTKSAKDKMNKDLGKETSCKDSLEDVPSEKSCEKVVEKDLTCDMSKKEESPKKTKDFSITMQDEALTSPKSRVNVTPGSNKKTPRRVQLITLSSPKSKKKLLE